MTTPGTIASKTGYDGSTRDRRRLQAALLADRDGLLMAARPRLRRLAQLRGVAPDAVDDVVQETLLAACRREASAPGPTWYTVEHEENI